MTWNNSAWMDENDDVLVRSHQKLLTQKSSVAVAVCNTPSTAAVPTPTPNPTRPPTPKPTGTCNVKGCNKNTKQFVDDSG